MLTYLSVCSGIEAATVAWHSLGWKPIAFSEIEAFPSAVLAHHYPNVPNLGDMTGFKDWPDATVDLLCGGTPCQSFSAAGLRAGLDDPRGQLMLTFGAIAARYRPRWLVWENVPGVLSSNGGRDFGSFLGLLGHLGYGFAYRVLDAQFVRVDGYARAVPQRRQRVFVVGCLGDWRSAAAVLLERESLRGDSAPRRVAGSRVTTCLDAGPDIGGDGSRVSRLVTGFDFQNCAGTGELCGTLMGEAQMKGGQAGHGVLAFDTTQITSAANRSNPKAGDPCHPLAAGAHAPAIAIRTANTGANGHGFSDGLAHTLDQAQGQAVAFGWQNAAAQGMGVGTITPTLDKSKHPAALHGAAVRRLMPVECERLQGFPLIAERVILDVCTDLQSGLVSVALQCLRWQSSVSPADGEGLTPYASTAVVDSSMPRAGRAPLAVLHVLPHSEGDSAELHSHARSSSSASGANGYDWCHRSTLPASSVRALAPVLRDLAHAIRSGKVASPLSMLPFTVAQSGSGHVPMFGGATEGIAGSAASAPVMDTFTTSDLGQLHPICGSREATLCCSVLSAIAGCIPRETLPASFSLELTVVTPYTAIPWRGKPASECPDGPRYKALGNSWAVNCPRWIGRRISMVECIRTMAGKEVATC